MLVIRLQRVGKKNQPFFRLVAADKAKHVQSKAKIILGFFNPQTKEINFKPDQITQLLNQGAQMSNRVMRLLKGKIIHPLVKPIDRPKRKPRSKKEAANPPAGGPAAESLKTNSSPGRTT